MSLDSMACLAPSHRDLSDSEVRIDLWKTLKTSASVIKICDIKEHEQARALISCGRISAGN
jgi:hypothetical protein